MSFKYFVYCLFISRGGAENLLYRNSKQLHWHEAFCFLPIIDLINPPFPPPKKKKSSNYKTLPQFSDYPKKDEFHR